MRYSETNENIRIAGNQKYEVIITNDGIRHSEITDSKVEARRVRDDLKTELGITIGKHRLSNNNTDKSKTIPFTDKSLPAGVFLTVRDGRKGKDILYACNYADYHCGPTKFMYYYVGTYKTIDAKRVVEGYNRSLFFRKVYEHYFDHNKLKSFDHKLYLKTELDYDILLKLGKELDIPFTSIEDYSSLKISNWMKKEFGEIKHGGFH